jgi:bifunctional non-homologous end joining protein LigD
VHVFVPVTRASHEDVAAAARGIAARVEQLDPALATTAFMKDQRGGRVFIDATRVGGATVVAAYSPWVRASVPVSFPLDWDELDQVAPTDFTIHTAPQLAKERPSGPHPACTFASTHLPVNRSGRDPSRARPAR